MESQYRIICFVVLAFLVRGYGASAGDSDPLYRACVGLCEETGCIGQRCFSHCKFCSDGLSLDGPWYMQEPLYLRWKQWDCHYHCMIEKQKEQKLAKGLLNIMGKAFSLSIWLSGLMSTALSLLNTFLGVFAFSFCTCI